MLPGNHDIDRTRHELCFKGGRAALLGPSQVDVLLEGGEDLNALLLRQENYRQFQRTYFKDQERTWTDDGLGYVSRLEIEEVHLAIIALDSVWLAEGGSSDHGQLLIGERQAINAIELVRGAIEPSNVIVGMAHHPLHLLRDFDRRPVQHRVEEFCQFFHCGHLHEPEARVARTGGTGCLTLTAGALFETRQSRNAHYVVALDVLHGTRQVDSFRFDPATGTFSLALSDTCEFEVSPLKHCGVGELAKAMCLYCPALERWAHYLSALLLGQKTEFPIPGQSSHVFGTFDVLRAVSNGDLRHATAAFLTFRNILSVLISRTSLSELLERHGAAIQRYGEALAAACDTDSSLESRLGEHEEDSRKLAGCEPCEAFSHTFSLWADLAAKHEWPLLRRQVERQVQSSNPIVATKARRMLALALANSEGAVDKEEAIQHYRSLVISKPAEFSDMGNLATLLVDTGCIGQATDLVLEGIRAFPAKAAYFAAIGQRIVEATGNRDFRKQLEDTMRDRQ